MSIVADRIKVILDRKKWSKNDLDVSWVQLSKLLVIKNQLIVIIKGNTINEPVWAKIENLKEMNGELVLYYDGEFETVLTKDEYDEYKEYIGKEEWEALFSLDSLKKLSEMNMIDDKGFYLEMHANMSKTENTEDVLKYEEVYKELILK
ncbi:hypothetical protein [Clostridium folliculivorans]|uniref:hypothetical protein n=1 Tax=Clostridium folliculivorans TaxID=2886038 RepID=UPI0021C3BCE8|nr:hypothetical protein [Clostridium folliculivorans]GKU28462.1 hypothetical protein CFB3_05680 [Clostridium folliculivorans]